MRSTSLCQPLVILEGPDGAGKTTLAKRVADDLDARYVHLPQLPHVKQGLFRVYVEAMLPALLGYQAVVMDRCWLSEQPYGQVYRPTEGQRVDYLDTRMLERLAMRCAATVIHCRPPLEACLASYRSRKGEEMLKSEAQLAEVYALYGKVTTDLPSVHYDYTDPVSKDFSGFPHPQLTRPHCTYWASAGSLDAKVLLVGDSFAEPKNEDPLYQWPFASHSEAGCSRWLTRLLHEARVQENQLLWVNADQVEALTALSQGRQVVALGKVAGDALSARGIPHRSVSHPQYHKRFGNSKPYPLIQLLKELL